MVQLENAEHLKLIFVLLDRISSVLYASEQAAATATKYVLAIALTELLQPH